MDSDEIDGNLSKLKPYPAKGGREACHSFIHSFSPLRLTPFALGIVYHHGDSLLLFLFPFSIGTR